MRMCLVALAFSLVLTGCAATTQEAGGASVPECSLVDQDATGTKITKKQECKDAPSSDGAGAPQR